MRSTISTCLVNLKDKNFYYTTYLHQENTVCALCMQCITFNAYCRHQNSHDINKSTSFINQSPIQWDNQTLPQACEC